MLVVTNRIKVPLKEIDFSYVRSSGPGGQNVNKVNSKAVLRWNIESTDSVSARLKQRFTEKYSSRINSDGEVVIASSRFRDQARNVADCLEKLRGLIESVAKPPKKRISTKPTKGSVRARLDKKKQNAQKKSLRKKVDY